MERERLLTIKEVMEMAGISRTTLKRDIDNGKLEAIYINRNVRFRKADVEEYVEQKKQSKWVMLHCGTKKDCTAQKI